MLNHRIRDLSFYYSFILEQFGRLFFDIHPTASSERSVRIFPLFSSVTPTHIFRFSYPNEVLRRDRGIMPDIVGLIF